MSPASRRTRGGEDPTFAPDRAAHRPGRRLDGQDQRRLAHDGVPAVTAASSRIRRASHRSPTGVQLVVAVVVAGTEGDPDIETIGGQGGKNHVAPLDQGDTVVEELGQRQVSHFGKVLDPIHVEVVDQQPPFVAVGQRERGTGDGLRHTQRSREALHEGGLSRAEITGQHDQVAGLHEVDKSGRQGARLLDRRGGGHDRAGIHSSIVSTEPRTARSYRDHRKQTNLVDVGVDFTGGGRHECVPIGTHVGRDDGAGEAVVRALGNQQAPHGVERRVGDHDPDGGVLPRGRRFGATRRRSRRRLRRRRIHRRSHPPRCRPTTAVTTRSPRPTVEIPIPPGFDASR